MVWPRIQWFGRGFGQNGSTSKRGAITAAAWTTERFEIMIDALPARTPRAAANAAPLERVSFIFPCLRFELTGIPVHSLLHSLPHVHGGASNSSSETVAVRFSRSEERRV